MFLNPRRLLSLTAALLLAAPHAHAQAQSAGATVHGSVTDVDSAIIPGATVVVSSGKGKPAVTKSGSDGSFRLVTSPGTYTVTVSMPGFANYSQTGVVLTLGGDAQVNAKLEVGEQTEVINVTSTTTTVSVDADSNASATVIKGKDLEALSDDPDELASELSALAGPAAGPNGGQIYVDGFTGGTLPPKSSIREIRINQNPFSAEFDKLGYGRVEVFTKPGTDKLHGSINAAGNDKFLNTSTPFLGAANSQPGYYTLFIMGNVTGPVSKTASFSIGGNYRNIHQNVIINPSGFCSASATSTTPSGPGTPGAPANCANTIFPTTARAFATPSSRFEIGPRLDFALGAKNVLTVRYQYENGTSQNSGVGGNSLASLATNTSSTENTIQISDTQTFSSRVVNETRFEYQRNNDSATPVTTGPRISVQGAFSYGGANPTNVTTNHFELQNYTSLALSKHFFRFGGRLRTNGRTNTTNGNLGNTNQTFTYSFLLDPCTDPTVTTKPSGCAAVANTTCASSALTGTNYVSSYQCGTPSQFAVTNYLQPTVVARQTDLGVYWEDDWKVKPNLTFSYGLRFEAANITSSHDFAPRTSIAYGIPRSGGKPPMTVLRAGFGIFYDRFGIGDILNTQSIQPTVQSTATVVNPGISCAPGSTTGCAATTPALTQVYTYAPNLRSPYIMQGAIGVDQQLGKIGTISLNWLPSRGNHEFLTQFSVAAPYYLYQYQSTGVLRENQFFMNANIRYKTVNFFGYSAFNFTNSNTQGDSFIPTSSDPSVDYGRSSFAQRGYVVAGGSWTAPYKISVSPFLLARSGSPYNVTLGQDLYGDSLYNARPGFASGSSADCSNVNSFSEPTKTGTGTVVPYNEIPVNYCTGPANVTFNLRLARTFGFGVKKSANATTNGTGGPNSTGPGGSPNSATPNSGGKGNRGGGGGVGAGFGATAGGGGGNGRGGFGGPPGGPGGNTGKKYNLTLGAQAQNLFNNVPYASPIATTSSASQFGTFRQLIGQPFAQSNAVRRIQLQATFNF